MKKLVILVLMVGVCTPAFAQSRGDTVTITNPSGTALVADKPIVTLNMKTGQSDTVAFKNSTSATMHVDNTSWPDGTGDKDNGGHDVIVDSQEPYTFKCDEDEGNWTFTITQAGADPVNVTVTINCTPIPTVSEWGLIVLTLLLLTGGAVVLRRRRAAAA